jgi:hypothetical protein
VQAQNRRQRREPKTVGPGNLLVGSEVGQAVVAGGKEPTVVVAAHGLNAGLTQQSAAAARVARPGHNVAGADKRVEMGNTGLQKVECKLKRLVFGVNVADNTDSLQWSRRLPRHGRRCPHTLRLLYEGTPVVA